MSVVDTAELFAREADHFAGNVDAVDLAEVTAHGAEQASGSAADFERRGAAGEARQLGFEHPDGGGRGGEELAVGLLAAAEGDVVVGVLAGALVPVGAHALQHVGVGHVYRILSRGGGDMGSFGSR